MLAAKRKFACTSTLMQPSPYFAFGLPTYSSVACCRQSCDCSNGHCGCSFHLSGSSSSNKSSSRSKLILPDIFLAANRFLVLSRGVLLGPRQSSGFGLVLLPRGRPRPLLRPSPASFASCSASLSDRAYVCVVPISIDSTLPCCPDVHMRQLLC